MICNRKQLHKTKPKRPTSNLAPIKSQLPNIIPIRAPRARKPRLHRSKRARNAVNRDILATINSSTARTDKAQGYDARIRAFDEEVTGVVLGSHWDAVIAGVGEADETSGS